MVANGHPVLPCWIALVFLPAIDRILLIEFIHVVVAKGLGQDAGRCDGVVLPVAFDNTLIRLRLTTVVLRKDPLLSRLTHLVGKGNIGIKVVAVDDELIWSDL